MAISLLKPIPWFPCTLLPCQSRGLSLQKMLEVVLDDTKAPQVPSGNLDRELPGTTELVGRGTRGQGGDRGNRVHGTGDVQ